MYLLLDIGGSKLRIATSNGKDIGEPEIIETSQYYELALENIKQIIKSKVKSKKFEAAIVGLPGPLDSRKTHLINAPNLQNWINQPIKEDLQKFTNIPVFLENDTALVGLGEANFGAGKGKNIVAYLTVSTGFGGARIVNGQIDHNALGFEPGHQIVSLDKVEIENLISGSALTKHHGKAPEEIADEKVWDKVAQILSIGINNTLVYWSPDILILGGSVTKRISLDKVRRYTEQTVKIYPKLPLIKKAILGDLGGLYGGLSYLLQKSS